ncbi:dynein axonemal assembly factor 6-like isoform X2 [Rhopilema esculentum]|uniref:dynein axonemal assembly factor 6-like isoform X2 n=1 Tax=Rhopilema esculentum TaxID=499914 RepID=UPI0031E47F83
MALDGLPVQKLAELLHEHKGDSDSDDDQVLKGIYQTPGSIGDKSKKHDIKTDQACGKEANNDKNIWNENEVEEDIFCDRDLDSRPSPEYDVMFKQKVTSDDIFLGMSGKNPSTACCEDLLIKIQLPDTRRTDIDLDVQDTFLDCRTPKSRLALHLPHKVDSKSGKADWDATKMILTVTLPLNRDFDFFNK